MRLSAQLGGGRCRKSRDRIFELTKSANGYKIYGQHVCVRNSAPQANFNADMAELADAQDLGSCGQPCRFDSCYPHQKLRRVSSASIFGFLRIIQESRGGKQAKPAQVGGIDRRLDSPRLGLSTVRRAHAANPVIRTKMAGGTVALPALLHFT